MTARSGAVACAVGLLLVACSGETADPDPSGPGKAEFVDAANTICRQTQRAGAPPGRMNASTRPGSPFARYVRARLIPAQVRRAQQIRALGYPDGDADLLGPAVDDYERISRDLDPVGLVTGGLYWDVDAVLLGYGLADCRGPSFE